MVNPGAGKAMICLVVISLLLFPDCGTISSGGDQGVPVTSSPPGAKVIVNGRDSGTTPAYLRLSKHSRGTVIRIEYPGYIPAEIRPKRSMPAFAVLGDILLGAAVGWLITGIVVLRDDYADGGKTALIAIPLSAAGILAIDAAMGGSVTSPAELRVNLRKARDDSPQVETILLDEDQFKNLKWIRVHLD